MLVGSAWHIFQPHIHWHIFALSLPLADDASPARQTHISLDRMPAVRRLGVSSLQLGSQQCLLNITGNTEPPSSQLLCLSLQVLSRRDPRSVHWHQEAHWQESAAHCGVPLQSKQQCLETTALTSVLCNLIKVKSDLLLWGQEMPGWQMAGKKVEQSSLLASKILGETKLLLLGSNTRVSKEKKLPKSVLVLIENSTVKYYREIKTQNNYLIYWELMCWSLTDKEESEGGEIVKRHNCPQPELKLPSLLWDFHS